MGQKISFQKREKIPFVCFWNCLEMTNLTNISLTTNQPTNKNANIWLKKTKYGFFGPNLAGFGQKFKFLREEAKVFVPLQLKNP